MDTSQLQRILRYHLKSVFYGVCAEDELPNSSLRPLATIVNTDPSNLPGTHWTCIYLFNNGMGEFFESFGRKPDTPVIRYLNRQASVGWVYNKRRLQGLLSTICGAYCLQYLEIRNRDRRSMMKTIVNRIFPYEDSRENDRLVHQRLRSHYGLYIPLNDIDFIDKALQKSIKYPK